MCFACVYRVFKGVFRGDSLQLFQGTNCGISPFILAISHEQLVIFTVGYRGQHKHTQAVRVGKITAVTLHREIEKCFQLCTLNLFDTVECIV